MKTDHHDRILGCLYGVATGDALGMPTSFLPPQEIVRIYGKITDFVAPIPDHIYHAGYKAGQVTDDTEQTILIAQTLLEHKKADAVDIARAMLGWFDRVGGAASNAVGPSSMAALKAIDAGVSLEEAGKRGDTNGAAMRISPVGILNSNHGQNSERLLDDVFQVCLPTHGSNMAMSGACALASGIAAAIKGFSQADIVQATFEGARKGLGVGFSVIGASVEKRIELAINISERHNSIEDTASEIYQVIGAGVAMAESVPAAIGLFYAAEGDPQRAILAAVNMGGDCDTVASMAGALAGAFAGIQAIPKLWIDTIEDVNELHLDELADRLFSATQWWNHAL